MESDSKLKDYLTMFDWNLAQVTSRVLIIPINLEKAENISKVALWLISSNYQVTYSFTGDYEHSRRRNITINLSNNPVTFSFIGSFLKG